MVVSPRVQEDSVHPRLQSGASARPLNFTVRRSRGFAVHFDEWLALSDPARIEAQKAWRPYEQGYWSDLLAQAAARFRKETAGLPHLVDVNYGIYHGGTLIIGVVTDLPLPERLDLPTHYLGFRLMQFHQKGRQGGSANA